MKGVCVRLGCTQTDAIEEVVSVKRETYSMLKRACGSDREGPVMWQIFSGAEARRVIKQSMSDLDNDQGSLDIARAIDMWLELHPDARLVVASVQLREGAVV